MEQNQADINKKYQPLRDLVGKTVTKTSIAYFEHDNEKEISKYVFDEEFEGEFNWKDDAQLQLDFEDGTVILFDNAPDGASLRFRYEPWKDFFEHVAEEELREYYDQYGLWKMMDTSAVPPFRNVIGKKVNQVELMQYWPLSINGIRFQIGDKTLNFVCEADCCVVFWGENNPFMEKHGFKVVEVNW